MKKIIIIIAMLAALVTIMAAEHPFLKENSAFYPSLRTKVYSSLLSENPSYANYEYVFRKDPKPFPMYLSLLKMDTYAWDDSLDTDGESYRFPGLSHPFENWRVFRGAFMEAFSTREPQFSIASFTYADSSLMLLADLNFQAGYEHTYNQDYAYGLWYKGFRINAGFNENFGMRADWYSGAYFGDADSAYVHSPLVDSFVKPESELWIDNLSADIYYQNQNLSLSLGRGKFQVGNSISGSIILNDRSNEYGYLLAEGSFGALTLSFLHGSLVADSTISVYQQSPNGASLDSKNYPDKFFALHQISYDLGRKLKLFFGETVIYGNRSLDLNYLLPNTFWRITEHNLQDRDNVLIFGGFDLKPSRRMTFYTQALIDELKYKELFSSWWGNKYAVQSGISYLLPIGGQNPRLSLEFTAVRPWTYTHFLDHNKYSHDQKPLGFPKGSNLIDYAIELNLPIVGGIELNSQASYTRQGSLGNDFSLNYGQNMQNQTKTTAQWLEGKITDTTRIQSAVKISSFCHHNFLLGMDITHEKDWQSQYFAHWQFVY